MSSPGCADLASNLRIASFSITLFDYIQTLPAEWRFYKRLRRRRDGPSWVLFLFVVSRYMGIVALVLNGVGFYSYNFSADECATYHLAPNLTKMIAAMASEGLIFIRTWSIARKSRTVFAALATTALLCIPVQILSNVYNRYPSVKDGNCTSRAAGTSLVPYHYLGNLVFDAIACGIATTFLIMQHSEGVSMMGSFTRRVFKNGLLYAFATTLSNLLVFLGQLNIGVLWGFGSTLSIAITQIMATHLVLDTQSQPIDTVAQLHTDPVSSPHTPRIDIFRERRFMRPRQGSHSSNATNPPYDFDTGIHVSKDVTMMHDYEESRRSHIGPFDKESIVEEGEGPHDDQAPSRRSLSFSLTSIKFIDPGEVSY